MRDRPNENPGNGLPPCATDFIRQLTKKIRYRRKVRQDVQAELTVHFEDELRDCADAQEREQRAKKLIEEFGDAGLLAILCRRAKKRCQPLWAKVAIRSVQVVAVLALYGALCSLRLFVGSPSFKVNYIVWLNERARSGREETLNARPYLDMAAGSVRDQELVQKALDIARALPGDINEPHRELLANVVEHNAQACDVLRQSMTRPYYWVQYETVVSEPPAAGVADSKQSAAGLRGFPDVILAFSQAMMVHGPGYRRLAQVFAASTCWRAHQGDVSGALDDGLVLMDFGMHLEGRGAEIEQLVGTAIEGLGSHTLFELLDRYYDLAGPELDRIEGRLADLYTRHESIIDITANRAVALAMIQQAFTDDGAGNGHVLKEGLHLAARDWKDGVLSLVSFGYPDRRETTSLIDAFWNEYQVLLDTEPSHPQYEQRKARWMALAEGSVFLRTSAPAHSRLVNLVWRIQTGRRALLSALAVLRYARDKGVYPPTLDALVAEGYMSVLPLDPYSGGPFGYRRTGDAFLLYSWGENLVDDGGQQGTDRNGKPRDWTDNGDVVFWPVRP